jgi:hypothetical protein
MPQVGPPAEQFGAAVDIQTPRQAEVVKHPQKIAPPRPQLR